MTRDSTTRVFVSLLSMAATSCLAWALWHWHSPDSIQFSCYLVVTALASSLKLTLPGIEGTMSVNFLFILLSILELSVGETLVLGLPAVLVQSYWKPSKRLKPIQIIFNLSQLTVSSAIAYGTYHWLIRKLLHKEHLLALAFAAITYFACNTMATAMVICLSEVKQFSKVWAECYIWSFPYYLLGAAIAGLVDFLNQRVGWEAALLVVPAIYVLYRSYRLYLGKLEGEKRYAEQMSALQLRTMEALALAIEAKDHTTHEHLQRVRVYAMELAKDLNLSPSETEALRAASVLHDIGKLAIPEHIISKPGKLTPEEFEKVKIHPIVAAEILEQVQFPYPVVPLVRAHEEKWDGTGYPQGMKGEEIPLGARILAAVDYLNALVSDRQYRRALSLDQAMAQVVAESAKL